MLLMLLAGMLHAIWHAIVKTSRGLPTLAGMGLVCALLAAPFLLIVPIPMAAAWPVLLFSLLLHTGYKLSLALAYQHGDLTRAYPLTRGMVPLFAALLSYAVLQQLPTPWQLAGILAICAGVFAIALERSDTRLNARLLLSAAGASAMVASYSVVDAYGVRLEGWGSFTVWLIVLDSLMFMAVARVIAGETVWCHIKEAKGQTITAGVLGGASFVIFVWALSRNPVAVVIAFRECSLLFAALIGLVVLGEPLSSRRALAITSIVAGLALVAAKW
ncbi:drug/metabolite transporter (DMT)-like permease [Tardiphaga robiniae]|nr:drug/metabolite transporter (DMT)-like permease [Tardiphaga robiniae]